MKFTLAWLEEHLATDQPLDAMGRVPATVPDPALLGTANARLEFAISATNQFIGPPLAGLLAAAGLVWVTGASSALYVATLPLLALMAGSYRAAIPPGRERGALTAGMAFLWRDRLLRSLTLITAVILLAIGIFAIISMLFQVGPFG